MAQNKTTLILNNLAELTFPLTSSRHIQIQGKRKRIKIQIFKNSQPRNLAKQKVNLVNQLLYSFSLFRSQVIHRDNCAIAFPRPALKDRS